jgi:hypothetical protein
MSVIKKTLFDEKLEKVNVLINDTDLNSTYFKITELNDTFTGGKNAFLIQGSEYLVADTIIKIQIKDANGDTIYYEPGEGIVSSSVNGESFVSEYYEGTSKVVAVYIYPNKTIDANGNPLDGTAFGPATITILGELKEYESNGLRLPIPDNWKDTYNVKWTRTVNVNPSLPNVTKIRFYRRPTATITELLQPLYSIDTNTGLKVDSGISQSFAQINLSNLETFAGDVKRVKVYRTSEGDISDYDLIQDVLLESKELLTTYGLSGSVIGETGIFTSETLQNYWNTGSLVAELTSSRVESGLKLSGSGIFTYTQSLDLSSTNTYELNLDAFYSSSVSSNLGIYLSYTTESKTVSSSIGTLYGTNPTKNLNDTVIPFTIGSNYPSASLYFSQSNGEWHLGNVSLKLSQDTAFSPDSVSFITTMPTILGNDVFNFKFEFYDLNNNYVPVFVTQSATFVGAPLDTGALISASLSQSLDALYKVSSSISGTMTVYSSSASGSITVVSGSVFTLSGSVSSSIYNLSSSVSQSNATILSSSLSKVQQLADGQYSGSFIGDTVIYSPVIGGQVGYIKELFTVGDTSAAQINLDARTSTRKIYIGTGTYNNTNTAIYLDSTGQFSLKDKLTFDTSGNLSVNGSITVTGGNAATNSNLSSSLSNTSLSSSRAADSASAAYNNAISQLQTLADGGYSGSFIGSTTIYSPNIGGQNGYISNILKVGQNGITLDGGNKAIYVGTGTYGNSNTPFYFASGSTDIFSLGEKLTFNGSALSLTGTINASSFNGGTITIGSKFAVDNLGNVSATNATLTGTVNADSGRFGSGSNYWTIGASTVENNVTTNGRLVLNAARPAMEIYDGSGDLRVDISAASTFSSTSPATITPSGDVTGQTSHASGDIGTGGSGASLYDSTQYFHNQSVTFSGASYVGKVATVRIPITGTAGSSTLTGTNIVGHTLSLTYGVTITKTGGTVVATLTGTRSVSTGAAGTATLPTYNGLVLTTGLTLENTTYTITPFISNINMQAYSSAGSVDDFSSTTYTPDFDGSISVNIPVGKTEIVAGGIQIIRDSSNYVKIDRAGSGDILEVKGNTGISGSTYVGGQIICVGDITANLSDARLKENIKLIENPLEKISQINGVYYTFTDDAIEMNGLLNREEQVGLLAQEVQKVLPHIIKPAPFDIEHDQYGNHTSRSGENYLTIQYEKIVPLLVEAIKELKREVEELKNR